MKKKSVLTLLAATTAFSGVAAVSHQSMQKQQQVPNPMLLKRKSLAQKLASEINYDKRKNLT